jgi:hypothetical protein
MRQTLDALYVCERESCAAPIALHRAAMAHERETGHHTERLTDLEAVALRMLWRAQNRCWLCGAGEHDHECAP